MAEYTYQGLISALGQKRKALYRRCFGIDDMQDDWGINTIPTSAIGYFWCSLFGHNIPDETDEDTWTTCRRCGIEDDRNLTYGWFEWQWKQIRDRLFPYVHLCSHCHVPMFSTMDSWCDWCWVEPSQEPWNDQLIENFWVDSCQDRYCDEWPECTHVFRATMLRSEAMRLDQPIADAQDAGEAESK
jgi:hypothetical protein